MRVPARAPRARSEIPRGAAEGVLLECWNFPSIGITGAHCVHSLGDFRDDKSFVPDCRLRGERLGTDCGIGTIDGWSDSWVVQLFDVSAVRKDWFWGGSGFFFFGGVSRVTASQMGIGQL